MTTLGTSGRFFAPLLCFGVFLSSLVYAQNIDWRKPIDLGKGAVNVDPYEKRFERKNLLDFYSYSRFFDPYRQKMSEEKTFSVKSFLIKNSILSHFYNHELLTSKGARYSRTGFRYDNAHEPKTYLIPGTYFGLTYNPSLAFIYATSLDRVDLVTELNAGLGLWTPFNQEQKKIRLYPDLSYSFFLDTRNGFAMNFVMGRISSTHDLPEAFDDAYFSRIPVNRNIIYLNEDPNVHYESTRGLFAYGFSAQLIYQKDWFKGQTEVFIDWQRLNLAESRERIIIGNSLRLSFYKVPLYFAAQFWHNGGEEYAAQSIGQITSIATGFHNDTWELLYLYSYTLPFGNAKGHALLMDYRFDIPFGFFIKPQLWMTSRFFKQAARQENLDKNYFNTVDGFPLARAPFYFRFDIGWSMKLSYYLNFKIVLQTSLYLRDDIKPGKFTMGLLSSQGIFLEGQYYFDLTEAAKNKKI